MVIPTDCMVITSLQDNQQLQYLKLRLRSQASRRWPLSQFKATRYRSFKPSRHLHMMASKFKWIWINKNTEKLTTKANAYKSGSHSKQSHYIYIIYAPIFLPTSPQPRRRPGMSDVTLMSGISGLSFDSPFLSPLLFFLPSPFFSFCLVIFCLMVHSPDFFP